VIHYRPFATIPPRPVDGPLVESIESQGRPGASHAAVAPVPGAPRKADVRGAHALTGGEDFQVESNGRKS
jgi:hypothetical protein